MSDSQRITDLKAMLQDGVLVVLVHEINTALGMIASGRVEAARKCLENASRYAETHAVGKKP